MKSRIALIALVMFFSTNLFAYTINNPRSWGSEIKCDSGDLVDIKQLDGEWVNPKTEEGFETMEEAALSSCAE